MRCVARMVQIARSSNIMGPYTKFGPPVLHNSSGAPLCVAHVGVCEVLASTCAPLTAPCGCTCSTLPFWGPGHCSVLQLPNQQWAIWYHAWPVSATPAHPAPCESHACFHTPAGQQAGEFRDAATLDARHCHMGLRWLPWRVALGQRRRRRAKLHVAAGAVNSCGEKYAFFSEPPLQSCEASWGTQTFHQRPFAEHPVRRAPPRAVTRRQLLRASDLATGSARARILLVLRAAASYDGWEAAARGASRCGGLQGLVHLTCHHVRSTCPYASVSRSTPRPPPLPSSSGPRRTTPVWRR